MKHQAAAPIVARLRALSPRAKGVYFACCAERLMPIYRAFADVAGWDTADRLERHLEQYWRDTDTFAPRPDIERELHEIAQITPHSDDFDTILLTPAQDCCICVDAALRSLMAQPEVSAEWAEYTWEAVLTCVCADLTGYVELGEGALKDQWEESILRDSRLALERRYQTSLVTSLELASPAARPDELRMKARTACWTRATLCGLTLE